MSDEQTIEFWKNMALMLKDELVIRGDAIVELYDALNERDNCRLCGGDGTRWTDVSGEPEAENCECADEAYRLLLKYGKLVMDLRVLTPGDEATP